MFWSRITCVLILVPVLLMSGCFRLHHTRGHYVDEDKLAQVKVGMSREDVAKILGTPTMLGSFKDEVWIYYGIKESHIAFFSPRVDSSKVLKISFDLAGYVQSIDQPQALDRDIHISNMKTKDLSHKKTIVRSIFGNVGRFNKSTEPVRPRVGGGAGY